MGRFCNRNEANSRVRIKKNYKESVEARENWVKSDKKQ